MKEEVPVALPISAKRLEVRLKNVHGVDKSVGYFSKVSWGFFWGFVFFFEWGLVCSCYLV